MPQVKEKLSLIAGSILRKEREVDEPARYLCYHKVRIKSVLSCKSKETDPFLKIVESLKP